MDGHDYVVSMSNTTIVADATLICVRAATAITSRASILEILEVRVAQQGVTVSQNLGILLGQKASAFGTFTSATPSPLQVGGNASGITGSTSVAAASAGVDASAEGGGAVTNILADSFNVLNGWLYVPVPEARIMITPDLTFIVKIVGTPGTLTGWSASLTFREVN
jgi:hypothetical protein